MAKVTSNLVLQGLSGMVGKTLVFKTWRGKTLVSAAPRKPAKQLETERQRLTRANFRQATHWARTQLLQPAHQEYFTQRAKVLNLPNAYTAAIAEYMQNLRAGRKELSKETDDRPTE